MELQLIQFYAFSFEELPVGVEDHFFHFQKLLKCFDFQLFPSDDWDHNRSASSETSCCDGSSAESHCFVTSSARSSPEGSSPVGNKFGMWAPAECLSKISSGEFAVLCNHRRPRNHQATNPATRATTGIIVPIAILSPSFRPPLPVLLGEAEVEEAVGVELVGVVSRVGEVEPDGAVGVGVMAVEEVEPDAVVGV